VKIRKKINPRNMKKVKYISGSKTFREEKGGILGRKIIVYYDLKGKILKHEKTTPTKKETVVYDSRGRPTEAEYVLLKKNKR